MDIAKIRKKIKGEAPDVQSGAASHPEPLSSLQEADGPAPETAPSCPSKGLSEDAKAAADEYRLPERADKDSTPLTELLTFGLSNEEYAVRIKDMQEIVRFHKMTMLPADEPSLKGIVSLRGKIVPVLDLISRLSLPDDKTPPENAKKRPKLLVISGSRGPIGIIVDRVMRVLRVQDSEMLEPPSSLSCSETRFIERVAISDGRFISVLKVKELTDFDIKTLRRSCEKGS